MPNMDDIAFFESLPYQFRGGIWADASRQERLPSTVLDEAMAGRPPVSDPPTTELDLAPQGSQSAEELVTTDPTTSLPLPEPPAVRPSATIPADDSSGSSKASRRRTWFSNTPNAPTEDSTAQASKDDPDALEGNVHRGRSLEGDRSVAPRSQSTPNQPERPPSDYVESPESDDSRSQTSHSTDHLSPPSPRRSSSRHSSLRDRTKSPASDVSGYLEPSSRKSTESTRSAPQSQPILPSSPTSFLSTLKSRAGDKQALKDTAKEAVRKWAVNWNTLRNKETPATSPTHDDLPDHGSIGSRLRAKDNNQGASNKTRSSYAEVRAAVAERKERESNTPVDSEEDTDGSSRVTKPAHLDGKGRVVSGPAPSSSSTVSPQSVVSDNAVPSASNYERPPTMESVLSNKRSSPSISRADGDLEGRDAAVPDPPKPIQSQPRATMMTIPGIHASHRGDVMSMGYVAPQPTLSTNKPVIPNVYRLWKSPVLSGQQQPNEQPGPGPSLSPQLDLDDGDRDVIPLALPPNVQSPQPTARPTPPPLPPRSSSVAVSRVSDTSTSSASEALKSIATKSENMRTRVALEDATTSASAATRHESTHDQMRPEDLDLVPDNASVSASTTPSSTNTNPGPPLPPRRIQASALA